MTPQQKHDRADVNRFIAACGSVGPAHAIAASQFYQSYADWCWSHSRTPMSIQRLTAVMRAKGFTQTRRAVRRWDGIGLKG